MAETLVIFSGGNPWYQSSKAKPSDLTTNSVGKSKKPKTVTKSRASAKPQAQVVNPIFESMAEICEDQFWKETFKNASSYFNF